MRVHATLKATMPNPLAGRHQATRQITGCSPIQIQRQHPATPLAGLALDGSCRKRYTAIPDGDVIGCSRHLHRRHKLTSVSGRFSQGWRTGSNSKNPICCIPSDDIFQPGIQSILGKIIGSLLIKPFSFHGWDCRFLVQPRNWLGQSHTS